MPVYLNHINKIYQKQRINKKMNRIKKYDLDIASIPRLEYHCRQLIKLIRAIIPQKYRSY